MNIKNLAKIVDSSKPAFIEGYRPYLLHELKSDGELFNIDNGWSHCNITIVGKYCHVDSFFEGHDAAYNALFKMIPKFGKDLWVCVDDSSTFPHTSWQEFWLMGKGYNSWTPEAIEECPVVIQDFILTDEEFLRAINQHVADCFYKITTGYLDAPYDEEDDEEVSFSGLHKA